MAKFDRSDEDLGNVVMLEHVNVKVPDQRLATLFYMTGLGLTRDPYLMAGVVNMWVNVGRSQFHLPTGPAQALRGTTGLVIPGRAALLERLNGVKKDLAETKFAFAEHNDYVEAVCPWGNRFRCYEPGPEFGSMRLGMPFVEVDSPPGSSAAIARFYREILGTAASHDGGVARASVGDGQEMVFRETDAPQPEYDGHHVAIYLADFSGPYKRLLERDLVSEESDQHQYRFLDIADLETGKPLLRLEHEVRSMRHPLYARPLVNRDPAMTNRNYAPGYEAASWALPVAG
ncbi:MAG: hypothetical protein RIM80_05940 [Alphaproteobacteria bacterium]